MRARLNKNELCGMKLIVARAERRHVSADSTGIRLTRNAVNPPRPKLAKHLQMPVLVGCADHGSRLLQ
jgi:hypothetical protein